MPTLGESLGHTLPGGPPDTEQQLPIEEHGAVPVDSLPSGT